MSDALSGYRRLPGREPRPIAQGLVAIIAAVLILGCGLLAGRLLADEGSTPAPLPSPSRSIP